LKELDVQYVSCRRRGLNLALMMYLPLDRLTVLYSGTGRTVDSS
jgi:hypothetical protein